MNKRKKTLYLIWIALIFLALLIVEIGLRRAAPPEQVPQQEVQTISIPAAVSRSKEGDVVRLVFVGGGVMNGFPYCARASVPELVTSMLQASVQSRRLECINLSAENVTGAVLAASLDSILQLQPDAIILQIGDEEFGTANLEHPRIRELKNRLSRNALRRIRVFDELTGLFEPIPGEDALNTMNPAQGLQEAIIDIFTENLTSIVQRCLTANIKPVLLDLASNLRDWAPDGRFSPSISPKTRDTLQESLQLAERYLERNDLNAAQIMLEGLYDQDSQSPQICYLLGVVHDRLRNWDDCREFYAKALDYDYLPQRAPRSIQNQLQKLSTELKVPLVKTDSVILKRISELPEPAPCPGFESFTDDKHPILEVRVLIARETAKALAGILGATTTEADTAPAQVIERLQLTDKERYDAMVALARRHLALNRTKRGMFLIEESMNLYPYHASAIELLMETYITRGMPEKAQEYENILTDLKEKEKFKK